MGMITRVRGRLHSITKLDPHIKDEKIAETVCLLSVLFLLPYCGGRGSHAPLLLKLGSVWLATYSFLVLPLLVSANYKYPVRWLRAALMYLPDLTFIFFYNICSVLNYLLPLYVIVDSWENAYLEHSALQTILNQLLFFTMCDLLFCTHARGNPFGLTGLNSLLFYYIITFFIKRILDIFRTFNIPNTNNNQSKNKSLILCILKIIIEWAKALIIILCLKEQGLQPHPNYTYTLVTFIYYVCTEAIFIEMFPKFLNYLNLENFEGLENLYAPVILNCCSLSLSLFLSTVLYLQGYNRLATFIFYHSIILNYKGAKSKCWQKLKDEQDILNTFRHASKKEIEEWNDICPICLQTMERARVTKCAHLFHAECLRKCCKVTNLCPLCKAQLRDIPNNSRNEIDVQ